MFFTVRNDVMKKLWSLNIVASGLQVIFVEYADFKKMCPNNAYSGTKMF